MANKERGRFISTAELAKILGVSRVTVFNRIKSGRIRAEKAGRNFVIDKSNIPEFSGRAVSEAGKKELAKAVDKTIREYGETLRLLGQE